MERVPKLRPGFRFQWEPAQNSHVLLYPEGMVKLNESASSVLCEVDGQQSVENIVNILESRFADAGPLKNDICQFLEDAHGQHWIIFE